MVTDKSYNPIGDAADEIASEACKRMAGDQQALSPVIDNIIRKHLNHAARERIELGGGEIKGEIHHWAVSLIAKSLQETLADAPNFVTLEILTPKAGPLVVTVHRSHRPSPPEAINELVVLIERLVAEHPAPQSDAYRDAAEYLASRAKAAQACAHYGAVEGLRHRVSWWRRVLFTASVVLGNLGRLGL